MVSEVNGEEGKEAANGGTPPDLCDFSEKCILSRISLPSRSPGRWYVYYLHFTDGDTDAWASERNSGVVELVAWCLLFLDS